MIDVKAITERLNAGYATHSADLRNDCRDLLAEVKRLTDEAAEVEALHGEEAAFAKAATEEIADLRRQITELQAAQRKRELRLIRHSHGWENVDPRTCLEMFNTQEPQS